MKYTVKHGDTLSQIAETHLGKASRYQELANHNAISNPDKIRTGQVIDIPDTASPRTWGSWLKYALFGK